MHPQNCFPPLRHGAAEQKLETHCRRPLVARGLLLATVLASILLMPGCPFNGILAPVIVTVSPNSLSAGSSAVTITVTGNNFQSSVVLINGQPVPTTATGTGTLQAAIPASMVASAGTASVTVGNFVPSGTLISNAVTITIIAPAAATISVTKTHIPSTFNPGGTAIYTITVSNTGTGPTSGTVTVNDPLPFIFITASASGSGWTCTVTGNATMGLTANCNRSDALPASSSYPPITISLVIATNASAGTVTNTVTVTNGSSSTPVTASDVANVS